VNGSNFQIEQQCPQCGAPIILDETDRILSCHFCRTRVYLATDDHFLFYIPPAAGISEKIYFIPYWRLKGLSYAITTHNIAYKYFDANFISFDLPFFPHSLGLRPQAMKLRFVGNADHEGKFIAASQKTRGKLLKNFKTQAGAVQEICIGETASIIYTPVYFANGRLYDAVLKKPLDIQKKEPEMEDKLVSSPDEKWHVDFLPLLCPECGADLPGAKDALIVFCENCHRAWNPSKKHFVPIPYATWREKGDEITYLPFWQLKVKVDGIALGNYADFIKVANLPKAPLDIWYKTPFYFFAPAFKLNPALFLRWCRQLTVTPAPDDLTPDCPVKNIHQVTLPVSEAFESCLVTLGSLMADKRHLADMLSSLKLTLEHYSLVLHPFAVRNRELVHTKLDFSMDISALTMGAFL